MNKLNTLVSNEFPSAVQEKWMSDAFQKKVKRAIKKKPTVDKDNKDIKEYTPYIKFCKEEREGVKEEYPDLNAKGVISKLGELWNDYKVNDPQYLKDKYNYVASETKQKVKS
ncbi:yabby-like transcription factor [Dasineura jujubifolia toursvirus 2a]|nr:yabby-like transcription factor [Dasineura jujubifolia toursvirus 2a]